MARPRAEKVIEAIRAEELVRNINLQLSSDLSIPSFVRVPEEELSRKIDFMGKMSKQTIRRGEMYWLYVPYAPHV